MGTLCDMDRNETATPGTNPGAGKRSRVPPTFACPVLADVSMGFRRPQPFAAGMADQT